MDLRQDRSLVMDLRQELARKLDFSRGISFQQEVLWRFNRLVHHPSSSPDGSFFLLVTFRRYTFRLWEESVALAFSHVWEVHLMVFMSPI